MYIIYKIILNTCYHNDSYNGLFVHFYNNDGIH